MSLTELISRITQEDAKVAFIISTFRGNPGNIQILSPDGVTHYDIKMESAVLRREVLADSKTRVDELTLIAVQGESNTLLNQFSEFLVSLLDLPLTTISSLEEIPFQKGNRAILLLKESGGKILWTWHHASDHREIGPRIRIPNLRSKSDDR
ncbi:MAG: hypothetical protein ACW98Y_02815 [Candidatus Thorarchaeota archaeon]|jgi:hypothetical protein